jgi:hypothetical protein
MSQVNASLPRLTYGCLKTVASIIPGSSITLAAGRTLRAERRQAAPPLGPFMRFHANCHYNDHHATPIAPGAVTG